MNSERCPICLDYIVEPSILYAVKTSCNHSFHRKCLDKWLDNNKTCPICRYDYVLNWTNSWNFIIIKEFNKIAYFTICGAHIFTAIVMCFGLLLLMMINPLKYILFVKPLAGNLFIHLLISFIFLQIQWRNLVLCRFLLFVMSIFLFFLFFYIFMSPFFE